MATVMVGLMRYGSWKVTTRDLAKSTPERDTALYPSGSVMQTEVTAASHHTRRVIRIGDDSLKNGETLYDEDFHLHTPQAVTS